MTNRIADNLLRKAARIAGLGYAAVFIFSILAGISGIPGLFDATTAASNLMANEVGFRIGISIWLIVYIADVVVAWALYLLLKPVNKSLSLLAALFRLIFTGIAVFTTLNLLIALQLSKGADSLGVFEPSQLQAQMMLFLNAYWDGILISFVFFGLHIFFIGYLILKSNYIPRVLGILLIVASIGYQINSFTNFLLPNIANYEGILFIVTVAVPAIIAELSLTLWLLIRGGKVEQREGRTPESA